METVLQLLRDYGTAVYVILFLYCALKSGALPLFGGYAAQQGALDPLWVAGVAFAGGYLGDEARFYAARRYGESVVDKRPRLAVWLDKARKVLDRYGTAYIFLYRYPKGMRTIGAFPIGLTDIPWLRFTALNAASALLWVVVLVGAGYAFGGAIDEAVSNHWGVGSVVMLGLFVALSVVAWRRVSRLPEPAGRR